MRTEYPSDKSYVLSGSLLNEFGQVVNALGVLPGSGESSRGVTHYDQAPPVTLVGICQVTDADDTCADGRGIDAYRPPCSSHNLFMVRPLTYDGDSSWPLIADEIRFDASAVYGEHQGLWKGEKCGFYYDPLAEKLVPLFPVPTMYVVELIDALASSDGTTATSGTCYLLERNTTTNALEHATDHEGADIVATVYSWYGSTLDAGTKWNVVRDAFGDLWIATGDC